MNIGGLNNPAGDAAALEQARARAAEGRPAGTSASVVRPVARPATAVSTPASAANGSGVASVQAPPGTDPALWSVLTTEERAFFAKATPSGPLTYARIASRGSADPLPLPVLRGMRIDVRA